MIWGDSPEATAGGGSAFIAQVTLYSGGALGVRISQACYSTGQNHERASFKQLLVELNLDGLLYQMDAPHTQKSFSVAPGAGGRLPADGVVEGFSEGVSQPADTGPPDVLPVPGKAQDPFSGYGL